MEILLIRHGETDWNVERRLQGHLDTPLNAEGRRQAAALGKVLSGEALDAVISSDLARAVQTAEAIAAAQGKRVRIEAGLRERCYGAFEGLTYEEISERYPEAYAAWRAHDEDARFPPGKNVAETLREFSARAIGSLIRSGMRENSGKIAVVSHGGVLDCVYRAAAGIGFGPPRDFGIFNAGINRLSLEGGSLRIVRWGDVSHLASETLLDEVDK